MVAGVKFPNLVGLAAGMDKDGAFVPASFAFGFGHVEVGTVTPEAQPGNPSPRLFRYPEDEALINRMGFNNEGVASMSSRLKALPPVGKRGGVVGVNLGKGRDTPLERAVDDYLISLRVVHRYADYLTINVSSPNTEGLRDLQDGRLLEELLRAVREERDATAGERQDRWLPIFVKIAPDLSFREVDAVLEAIERSQFDGVVATNTTVRRDPAYPGLVEAGGLSGRPLERVATERVRYIAGVTRGSLPIIGVGGILDERGAGEKLDAGASLIQIYTGWVYRGPFFPRELVRATRTYQRALAGQALF